MTRYVTILSACALLAVTPGVNAGLLERPGSDFPPPAEIPSDVDLPYGPTRLAQAPGTPARPRPGVNSATQPPAAPAPAPVAPAPAPAAPAAPPAASPGEMARSTVAEEAALEAAAAAAIDAPTFNETPIMLGDVAPLSVRQFFQTPNLQPPPAPVPGQPPLPQSPAQGANRFFAVLPWIRGFKMADNMSPRPQDRVFFSFNYFNDLNGSVNQRLGDQIRNIQVYRELFGVEKTFFDGNASIGLRMPLDSFSAQSQVPGLGGTDTAVGNVTVFSKFIVWQDQSTGSLVSSGLAVTMPTGPFHFASAASAPGFRDTQLQPFVGYIWSRGRFYAHGFESIDVPTLSRDVTMLYNDVGIGYFLYRSPDPSAHLTAIVPTFETHVNVPLNHRGSLRIGDPAGTPDVVDLTFGTNVVFGRNAVLTFGLVTPITGPRPFDLEVSALVNVFFGRTRALPTATPPVAGL